MAFTGYKKDKKTEPGVADGLESTPGNDGSLDFLAPKKDAVKDSMNDPYRAELTQKSAYQYTLKTLNALKIVSPIISALMENPGVDATNETLSENFKVLITETSAISELVCEKLGIDPNKEKNFWIRNVLEKSFSEIIHDQWVAHGKVNMTGIEHLVESIISFSEKTSEKTQYDDIPEESLVKLSAIKAMLPVLNEAQNFGLYRDLENDIEPIMTKLFQASTQAVEKLSDDYANSKDKAKLFYMIVQEAGNLYASAWKAEGKRITEIMASHPPEKLQKILENYKTKGGLPLTKVEGDFDKYFGKMLIITEKLVLSQKGNIAKRLKK